MRLFTRCMLLALAAALLAAPSGASAAERCLYQGLKVTAKNEATVERSLLCLTNLHRLRRRPSSSMLRADTRLNAAARGHSADMVARGYFDHVNPEGQDASARAMAAGYPGVAGENIAANTIGTAASLFQQWKHSPPHNGNMLSPSFQAIGVGVAPGFPGGPADGSGGITGTQNFGFVDVNTSDTGLDLYASSKKCAKARMALIAAKRRGDRRAKFVLRGRVKSLCEPLE